MSLDALLIHTCTIENPSTGRLNAYKNAKEAYALPLEGVRCRLIESRELVDSDETTEKIVKSEYMLMVAGEVDLQDKARISLVTLEDETTISDTFRVMSVLHRRGRNSHHKSALLERIS